MRFLADMPISPLTVEFLKSMGHEAVRLNELGMRGAEDEEIIVYAHRHKFVILTMDLDFGGLLVQKGWAAPSVITFRLENPEVARINKILKENLPTLAEDLERGAIVIVEESRLRVRALPIQPPGAP